MTDRNTKDMNIPPGTPRKLVVRTWAMSVFCWEMAPAELSELVDKLYGSQEQCSTKSE